MTGRRHSRNSTRQRGLVSTEFAVLMVLVLAPLLFGLIDCTKFLVTGNVLSRAVREGAVVATRGEDPQPAVIEYAEAAGLEVERVQVRTEADETYPASGSHVRVFVEYDLSDFSLIPWEVIYPRMLSMSVEARVE